MTELEKMAIEYAETNPTNLTVGQWNPTIPAYLAGFRKAREMALEITGKDPELYHERIQELGDSPR